jgi:hypothetical protein
LLLPADADLVPALWDDEARGLVKQTGLVFLPGGRILGFAIDRPLSIADLVSAPPARRSEWQSFPAPEPLAGRLHEIILDLPPPTSADILDSGGEDIGNELPRPGAGGLIDTITSKVAMTAGQGLMNLGKLFGLAALTALGARWIASAVERAPRLSESILGRQEAALRELLRLFQDGRLEQALRRALPLGGPSDRGGVPYHSAQLPTHSLLYSLGNLLGGRGRASIWFGGYDVQAELAKEYRKAAEEAAKRGDYRRAAYIYARLLQDYRSAANVLYQGGLYRDAAVIYTSQLDDRYQAARAYEAAGEIDTALHLYRQLGRHVEAGNLLRRIGEDEAALAEYLIAASQMVEAKDWLGAGDLLNQAGWPDLARQHYAECWQRRPEKNDVACALRLANFYQSQGAPAPLLAVLRDGRAYFDPPGREQAACQFYNEMAKLAVTPPLAPAREEIRDLALLGVAVKLRQSAAQESRPGDTVFSYLGQSDLWAAPLRSDAQYAFRTAVKEPVKESSPRSTRGFRERLGTGRVTAVVSAPSSGDVFVAFDNGDLVCFRPTLSETQFVKVYSGGTEVRSLAVDGDGNFVITLQPGANSALLTGFSRLPNGSFRLQHHADYEGRADWMTPLLLQENGVLRLGLWTGGDLLILNPSLGVSRRMGTWKHPVGFGALLLPSFEPEKSPIALLHWYGPSVFYHRTVQGEPQQAFTLSWDLGKLQSSNVQAVPLAWLKHGTWLELAGIDEEGALHWSKLAMLKSDKLAPATTSTAAPDEGYVATAIVRPGLIAGVTRSGVNWLRGGQRFLQVTQTPLRTEAPVVAAFASLPTNELLLICGDGVLERLPVPNV